MCKKERMEEASNFFVLGGSIHSCETPTCHLKYNDKHRFISSSRTSPNSPSFSFHPQRLPPKRLLLHPAAGGGWGRSIGLLWAYLNLHQQHCWHRFTWSWWLQVPQNSHLFQTWSTSVASLFCLPWLVLPTGHLPCHFPTSLAIVSRFVCSAESHLITNAKSHLIPMCAR